MLMANAVTELAIRTPGKESVAMESFAKALRMVSLFSQIAGLMHVKFQEPVRLLTSDIKWLLLSLQL